MNNVILCEQRIFPIFKKNIPEVGDIVKKDFVYDYKKLNEKYLVIFKNKNKLTIINEKSNEIDFVFIDDVFVEKNSNIKSMLRVFIYQFLISYYEIF